MEEYGVALIFLCVSVIVSVVVEVASYVLGDNKSKGREKLTAYECGFDAFEDARVRFDVRFYLVGMLFIVFDLEASFLFPWGMSLDNVGGYGYWGMIDFIIELCVGYVYVWRMGGLVQHEVNMGESSINNIK